MSLKPVADLKPQWIEQAKVLTKLTHNWLHTKVADSIQKEADNAPIGKTKFRVSVEIPNSILKNYKPSKEEHELFRDCLLEALTPLGYDYTITECHDGGGLRGWQQLNIEWQYKA